MGPNHAKEAEIQRRYYRQTASQYDAMRLHDQEDEHRVALSMLVGMLDYVAIGSLLDVGSGTGRAITYPKKARPDLVVMGVEPVQELREVAYACGLSPTELTDGDALDLRFADDEFDLVCAFGVLHHIRQIRTTLAKALGCREAPSKLSTR